MRELLTFPPPDRPAHLSEYHPYNRLERLVHGRSHLDRLKDPESSPTF
ncbi:MAG: hypothetical protein U5R31_15255 [Acidimicrobiia bacterium]|nr:hypothetical protein [Acidimicrobiia bacterium]